MATTIAQVETLARKRLDETTARFWTSAEIVEIIISGIKDLWRDIVNLKQEHFLTINESVTLAADGTSLSSVPSDVHKVYLIEAINGGTDEDNYGLKFEPMDYNHPKFIAARHSDSVDPSNQTIYYAIHSAGAPVAAPTVRVAPAVTSAVDVRFVYIPTISSSLASSDNVPIPGDVDNALVAWTVAYARAKEREDFAPDPNWLAIYNNEKELIRQSLGVRQLQEPTYVDAIFEEYTPC